MDANISKKILWDYFEGRITAPQKQFLLDWLKTASHQEIFYDVLHEWEKANPQLIIDQNSDWHNLLSRLEERSDLVITDTLLGQLDHKRNYRGYWRIVASLILMILAGWWQSELLLYKSYTSSYGETRSFLLSDGSRVTLNADSRLLFPRFDSFYPNREARLWGEAEFSVVHTVDNRPFFVKTQDQLEVKVLGTEFVVYSRQEESKVVLTKGKVQLRSLKNDSPPLDIEPGDVVSIDSSGIFNVENTEQPEEHLAWKEHRFSFNRTPLSEISKQIRERFGVELIIEDANLEKRTLTGNYPAETIDEVILMLTQVLNVRSEKIDNKRIRLQQ